LSALAAQHRTSQLRDTLAAALRATFILGIPAALGLVLLGRSLVELLFGGGRFGAASTEAVLAALSGYAVGLVGFAAIEVAVRAFFARQDTRTPLVVAVLGMVATVVLSLLLREPLGHAGLALAASLGITIELGLLLWLVHRTLGGLDDARLGRTFLRASLAAAIMGLALVGLQAVWPLPVDALLGKALFLGTELVLGLAVYLCAAWCLGLEEIRALGRMPWRRRLKAVFA
jgi:putative peptidoglycan lipid II flippase